MKRLLLTTALLAAALCGHATERQALTLHMRSGADIIYYLDTEPRITFEAQTMVVADGEAPRTIPMADVINWQIGMIEHSGIAETTSPSILVESGRATVFNPAGARVCIYDTAGRLCASTSECEQTFPLPHGIYIVTIADKSHKIAIR